MNISVPWFIVSIVFLWAYGLAAKKLEAPLLERKWTQRHLAIAWLLLFTGFCFVAFKAALVFFRFDQEKTLPSLFVWFCAHGIFAVLVARIAVGLAKCIREYRGIPRT
jgi:hypothetical protein